MSLSGIGQCKPNNGIHKMIKISVSIDVQNLKEAGTNPLSSNKVVRDYDRHWTPIHLDFLCDNVDELVS